MVEPEFGRNGIDGSQEQKGAEDQKERKELLIAEILELQNTLHDLSQRVHTVREENDRLQTDNEVHTYQTHPSSFVLFNPTLNLLQVLDQYILNLMDGSDVFQPAHK